MAHVGKKYPLAFRRDLAFGINNNQQGWGRAYYFLAPLVGGSIPPAMVVMALVCTERDPGSFHALWESEETVLAGRRLVARMIIDNTTRVPESNEARWELHDSVRGFIGKGRVIGRLGDTYGIIDLILENGPDPAPDLWNVGIFKEQGGFALDWDQWNNL